MASRNSAEDDLGNCERGAGCTTIRQNAHNTKIIVRYAWHPWFGRTVGVRRTIRKKSQVLLHVVSEEDPVSGLREIPAWMADSASCVRMRSAQEPVVACEALKALGELIQDVVPRPDDSRHEGENLIEKRHLGSRLSQPQGDANATTHSPLSPSCSTRSLSSSPGTSPVGNSATRDSGESHTPAGTVSEKVPGDTSCSEGGDR